MAGIAKSAFSTSSSFSGSSGSGLAAILVVTLVVSAILAILALVFITPEKRRPGQGGFFRWLANVFNFRSLLIEGILKFFYITVTLLSVLGGFVLAIYSVATGDISTFFAALLSMILGPFVIRLMFEFLMLFILLVKNVIEINKKLGGTPANQQPQQQPYQQQPVGSNFRFGGQQPEQPCGDPFGDDRNDQQ